MAVPTTWTELKATIADWTDRTDTTTQIADFIGYAENRFNRELFGPEREASATLSASAETVTLPTDLWGIRTAYVNLAPRRTLVPTGLADLRDEYPASSTGRPEKYAIVAGNMHLGPIPNGTYSIPISYYQTIPALGAGQATNWLLTAHPDLYLAASLAEAFLFERDEERAALWDGRAAGKIADINRLGVKKRHGATPLSRTGAVVSVSRFIRA